MGADLNYYGIRNMLFDSIANVPVTENVDLENHFPSMEEEDFQIAGASFVETITKWIPNIRAFSTAFPYEYVVGTYIKSAFDNIHVENIDDVWLIADSVMKRLTKHAPHIRAFQPQRNSPPCP